MWRPYKGALHNGALRAATAIPRLQPPGGEIPDWFSRFPADRDALGNADDGVLKGVGDCVPAARCQVIRLWGGAADRDLAYRLYAMRTGFNPATLTPDNGTDTLTAMFASCAAPVVDEAGRAWPILWAKVDHKNEAEIERALAHYPLEITVQMPAGDLGDDPESWCDRPMTAFRPGTESHRIVLGGRDDAGWRVRTWGMDVTVHPELFRSMLLAVDVPIPHPDSSPAELVNDGIDYAYLISAQPQRA